MPTNKKLKGKPKKPPKERSVDDLIQAAEAALLTQNPEHAIVLYKQASNAAVSDPTKLATILEQSAHARISLADQEGARGDYLQALAVLMTASPPMENASHLEQMAGLRLYIGQLQQGKESLQEYKAGIDLLQTAVKLREERLSAMNEAVLSDETDDNPTALYQESKRQLASAYCNAADLFLTDLCFEDNAEHECEAYMNKALAVTDDDGQPSLDALQTATSLRLSQNRGLEAVDYALQVYQRMRVGCDAVCDIVGFRGDFDQLATEEARELAHVEEAQSLPEFEFRVQTSKLLLECSGVLKKQPKLDQRADECVQAAIRVLGSLWAENDEVVEICYLLGEAFSFLSQLAPALQFYERAKEMLASIQQSIEEELMHAVEDSDDMQQQLDAVTCQLEECISKIEELEERLESTDSLAMEE